MDVIISHEPACSTSRNALALIRHCGIEPHVIEYLKTPPPARESCRERGDLVLDASGQRALA
jgi:arsenate reductase-like glutaredoxin family protein